MKKKVVLFVVIIFIVIISVVVGIIRYTNNVKDAKEYIEEVSTVQGSNSPYSSIADVLVSDSELHKYSYEESGIQEPEVKNAIQRIIDERDYTKVEVVEEFEKSINELPVHTYGLIFDDKDVWFIYYCDSVASAIEDSESTADEYRESVEEDNSRVQE